MDDEKRLDDGQPLDEGQPLDDGQLEGAAGGYLFYYADAPGDADWEVLDDRGDVVSRHETFAQALYYARTHGYGEQELTWAQLWRLREYGSF